MRIRERDEKEELLVPPRRLLLIRERAVAGISGGADFFRDRFLRHLSNPAGCRRRAAGGSADRRRLVAIRREHIDEDVGRSRQDAAVIAETMHSRVAAGHEGGPVRHADGRCGVEILKPHAIRR